MFQPSRKFSTFYFWGIVSICAAGDVGVLSSEDSCGAGAGTSRTYGLLRQVLLQSVINHSSVKALQGHPQAVLSPLVQREAENGTTSSATSVADRQRGKLEKPEDPNVLWPSRGKLPKLTGSCLCDFFIWALAVVILLLGIVLAIGWLIGKGASADSDADDSDYVLLDEDEWYVSKEEYDRFTARKRVWIFLRVPESGPLALAFSLFINATIFVSLVTMTVESVHEIKVIAPGFFVAAEWYFLVVFTMEWMAGIFYCQDLSFRIKHPMLYIDGLAVVPSYMDVILHSDCSYQSNHVSVLFLFRILRIFRVLRLAKLLLHSDKVEIFRRALMDAIPAAFVFFSVVSTVVFVPSVLMWNVEQGEWSEERDCYVRKLDDGTLEDGCSPFQSIPMTLYWAVSTVTTVGYGDVTPVTRLGKVIAGLSMLLAMLSIAIPVGMITNSFNAAIATMKEERRMRTSSRSFSPSGSTPHGSRKPPPIPEETWDRRN